MKLTRPLPQEGGSHILRPDGTLQKVAGTLGRNDPRHALNVKPPAVAAPPGGAVTQAGAAANRPCPGRPAQMSAIRWKSKVILFKIEASEGVDPVPTGAANAILAIEVTLTPMDGDDVGRNLELPYLAAQPTVATGLRSTLKFKVELAPSGAAGTAPAWGPLLRACGVAETIVEDTSVAYNPITDAQESASIYFQIGGTRHILLGCRGDITSMGFTAQDIPYLEFAFTGLFTIPAEHAVPSPVLTAFQKPLLVTTAHTPTFTVDGVSLVMRDFAMALNNSVQPRLLVGSESILIVDRGESIKSNVQAVPLTTYDPFSLAADQTTIAIELVHGTEAGLIATLDVPTAQQKRLSGYTNQQNILEWPLEFVPLPATGNDQWVLTLT